MLLLCISTRILLSLPLQYILNLSRSLSRGVHLHGGYLRSWPVNHRLATRTYANPFNRHSKLTLDILDVAAAIGW